MKTGQEYRTSR